MSKSSAMGLAALLGTQNPMGFALLSDISSNLMDAPPKTNIVDFITSGTYSKKNNVGFILVYVLGAGGAGGMGYVYDSSTSKAGGGGGGGLSWGLFFNSQLDASTLITIASGVSSGAGGDTSFGDLIIVNAGGPGGNGGGYSHKPGKPFSGGGGPGDSQYANSGYVGAGIVGFVGGTGVTGWNLTYDAAADTGANAAYNSSGSLYGAGGGNSANGSLFQPSGGLQYTDLPYMFKAGNGGYGARSGNAGVAGEYPGGGAGGTPPSYTQLSSGAGKIRVVEFLK